MISFHVVTEVKADRCVVLELPPETPLGEAELFVRVAPCDGTVRQPGGLRRLFGAAASGDTRSADNEKIDADLIRAYEAHDDKAE